MSDQLDLLTWTPPPSAPAVIVRFPVAIWGPTVWRPRVERTAINIVSKTTQRARERYWDQCCHGVAGQLRRHGATEAEVMAELHRYFAAVDYEMARHRRSGPGAA